MFRNDLHAGDEAPLASRFRVAGVDNEAIQPRLEALEVTEVRQATPRAQERLLRGVLRTVWVAQDAMGEGVAAIDVRGRESPEGVPIAARRPLHEVRLHRELRSLAWRPIRPRH